MGRNASGALTRRLSRRVNGEGTEIIRVEAGVLPRPKSHSVLAHLALAASTLLMLPGTTNAQVVVNDSGRPQYSYPIYAPPGRGGLTPSLSLVHTGGPNGLVGQGWTIAGVSVISRCGPTRAIDGNDGSFNYSVNDKLCLDGQRLIQTDATGQALPFPQSGDSASLAQSSYREFRLERDPTVRVRAYGTAYEPAGGSGGSPKGPAHFKVWTKDGKVSTYGVRSWNNVAFRDSLFGVTTDTNPRAYAWAVARTKDMAGNAIEYSYGTRVESASVTEWNLAEVAYNADPAGQTSPTSIFFSYDDRSSSQDRGEAYFGGQKRVVVSRLSSISINVAASQGSSTVKTIYLTYNTGTSSGRSTLASIKECLAVTCLPKTSFEYTSGSLSYSSASSFSVDAAGAPNGLLTLQATATNGKGILTGDFNGDGRTDFIRWSDTPSQNALYLSEGIGNYRLVPTGTGAGQFNIADQKLQQNISGRPDLCHLSIVADFDGDGLADILRFAANGMRADSSTSPNCGSGNVSYLYKSNGDGSFTRSIVRDSATQQELSLARTRGAFYSATNPYRIASYNNFVVGDFNRDGRLDILAMRFPQANYRGPDAGVYCYTPGGACNTTLWLGNGDGSFTAAPSSGFGTGSSVWAPYLDPMTWSATVARDHNGDGVPDLAYPPINYSTQSQSYAVPGGYFAGNATGGFSQAVPSSLPDCVNGSAVAGDFNGDGLVDSFCAASGGNTIRISNGHTYSVAGSSSGPTGALMASDVDGDGRADLINLSTPKVYRWSGAGTFTDITSSTGLSGVPLSGTGLELATGNFTGQGSLEFLIFNSTPSSTPNRLYAKADGVPPDLLTSVTTPAGAVTTFTYKPLTATTRYASDRGTADSAVFPAREATEKAPIRILPAYSAIDVSTDMAVVVTQSSDSGVGMQKNLTEFAYRGFKVDQYGRGGLGFREIRRQSVAPDNSLVTTVTKKLQQFPYVGSAAVEERWLGALSPTAQAQTGQLLSRTENVYCDQTAAAGAELTATTTAPCPTTAKVQRPYHRKSVATANDLTGAALPTVTTTTTYTGGYPTLVKTDTVGVDPAGTHTSSAQTAFDYWPDAIGGDDWLLGLVKQRRETRTVPNRLGVIPTSAGTAPKATATSGP